MNALDMKIRLTKKEPEAWSRPTLVRLVVLSW